MSGEGPLAPTASRQKNTRTCPLQCLHSTCTYRPSFSLSTSRRPGGQEDEAESGDPGRPSGEGLLKEPECVHFQTERRRSTGLRYTLQGTLGGRKSVPWDRVHFPGHFPGHYCVMCIERSIIIIHENRTDLCTVHFDERQQCYPSPDYEKIPSNHRLPPDTYFKSPFTKNELSARLQTLIILLQ